MRYRDLTHTTPLTEKAIRIDAAGHPLTVIENPSIQQVLALLDRYPDQEVKGLIIGDDLYFWSGINFATHGHIAEKLWPTDGHRAYWEYPEYVDGRLIIAMDQGYATISFEPDLLNNPRILALLKSDRLYFHFPGAGFMNYSEYVHNEQENKQHRAKIIHEGRDAPLYHMMDATKADSIFRNDTMYATTQHKLPSHGLIFGSSFTRMAQRWQRSYGSVWIEVDQTMLDQRHEIIPVDGERALGYKNGEAENARWSDRNGEQFAEEFVVGDINDLHKYVRGITVIHSKQYRHLTKEEKVRLDAICSDYSTKWNIPIKVID